MPAPQISSDATLSVRAVRLLETKLKEILAQVTKCTSDKSGTADTLPRLRAEAESCLSGVFGKQGGQRADLASALQNDAALKDKLMRPDFASCLASCLGKLYGAGFDCFHQEASTAPRQEGRASALPSRGEGFKTILDAAVDICDTDNSNQARANYGRSFIPELLKLLGDPTTLHVDELRQVAQLLLVLVQNCDDNQKALESHLKGPKSSHRAGLYWNCLRSCGDLLVQLDLLEALYRCGRRQLKQKQRLDIASKSSLGHVFKMRFNSMVRKKGAISSSACCLANELHLLADVLNDCDGVEAAATVHSFRPVASLLRDFQHDDAEEELLRARGPAEQQIVTFNRCSILYTFFTATERPKCVEVDMRHSQIESVTLDKPNAATTPGPKMRRADGSSWRLAIRLKDPPAGPSEGSSICSPGTGNSGSLELWFSPADGPRIQRLLVSPEDLLTQPAEATETAPAPAPGSSGLSLLSPVPKSELASPPAAMRSDAAGQSGLTQPPQQASSVGDPSFQAAINQAANAAVTQSRLGRMKQQQTPVRCQRVQPAGFRSLPLKTSAHSAASKKQYASQKCGSACGASQCLQQPSDPPHGGEAARGQRAGDVKAEKLQAEGDGDDDETRLPDDDDDQTALPDDDHATMLPGDGDDDTRLPDDQQEDFEEEVQLGQHVPSPAWEKPGPEDGTPSFASAGADKNSWDRKGPLVQLDAARPDSTGAGDPAAPNSSIEQQDILCGQGPPLDDSPPLTSAAHGSDFGTHAAALPGQRQGLADACGDSDHGLQKGRHRESQRPCAKAGQRIRAGQRIHKGSSQPAVQNAADEKLTVAPGELGTRSPASRFQNAGGADDSSAYPKQTGTDAGFATPSVVTNAFTGSSAPPLPLLYQKADGSGSPEGVNLSPGHMVLQQAHLSPSRGTAAHQPRLKHKAPGGPGDQADGEATAPFRAPKLPGNGTNSTQHPTQATQPLKAVSMLSSPELRLDQHATARPGAEGKGKVEAAEQDADRLSSSPGEREDGEAASDSAGQSGDGKEGPEAGAAMNARFGAGDGRGPVAGDGTHRPTKTTVPAAKRLREWPAHTWRRTMAAEDQAAPREQRDGRTPLAPVKPSAAPSAQKLPKLTASSRKRLEPALPALSTDDGGQEKTPTNTIPEGDAASAMPGSFSVPNPPHKTPSSTIHQPSVPQGVEDSARPWHGGAHKMTPPKFFDPNLPLQIGAVPSANVAIAYGSVRSRRDELLAGLDDLLVPLSDKSHVPRTGISVHEPQLKQPRLSASPREPPVNVDNLAACMDSDISDESNGEEEMTAMCSAVKAVITARRKKAARKKQQIAMKLKALCEVEYKSAETKIKTLEEGVRMHIQEEYSSLEAELNHIAEDIVKAKINFEQTMRGLWENYAKTCQRLRSATSNAEAQVQSCMQNVQICTQDLEGFLHSRIKEGKVKITEEEAQVHSTVQSLQALLESAVAL